MEEFVRGKLVFDHTWHQPRPNRSSHVRLTFIGKDWQQWMLRAVKESKRRGVRLRRVIREWGIHKSRVVS